MDTLAIGLILLCALANLARFHFSGIENQKSLAYAYLWAFPAFCFQGMMSRKFGIAGNVAVIGVSIGIEIAYFFYIRWLKVRISDINAKDGIS